jgi:ABC-type glycerol-3-phosphate transport system permease component
MTYQPKMDWSNYLVIVLLVFLIFLGIVGTMISKTKQSNSKIAKAVRCFSFVDNFRKVM